MIESLLIANRGEIARRIIRTARRLGVRTIAVHSDVDAGLPFVTEADQAVCIGPAPARESYLDQAKILAAARATGAAAIHPGYGFLSENAEFAEAVVAAGLVWVGAPATAIRAMGLKDAAKARMIAAGVPVTPGYLGEDQSRDRLQAEADAIGYPVLIKAVAGGGGKGMRRVDDAAAFADALDSCRREAAASFGDDRVLIEKYILSPRHIEVQVFGDTHGNAVHLFERDCSLQRRHQKVIEEAPAPGMDAETRASVCDAAVRAARLTAPAVIVVGEVVNLRETLSWFETKPLFGWRVLVPRTKEQAGTLSSRLRGYGAVPEEVPTISVEPPRNPQQMDKAVRGLVEGRYEWIAFTSVNAVRAVRLVTTELVDDGQGGMQLRHIEGSETEVRADVVMTMSRPRRRSILSYSISGNTICSLMPQA